MKISYTRTYKGLNHLARWISNGDGVFWGISRLSMKHINDHEVGG